MTNYKLKELIKIHNGTKYSHLEEGEVPLYGSGGIMSYVNDFLYEGEAVLLPRKGTLTNIMYVNSKIWTVDTMYYAATNEKVEPYYLYSYLSLLDLKYLDSGSALPSMTKSSYDNLEVKLPSISTQKQIAKVLSDLDAKIEVNNKINQELEAMAKTLYDYWFVQFDFPAHLSGTLSGDEGYKSSGGKMVFNEELKREIPEGWKVGSLLDIANFQNGLACQKYRPIDDTFLPVIKIREMRDGFTDNTEKVRKDVPDRIRIFDGDVLFSWSASLEVMIWSGGNGALNQHIFKVTSDDYPKSYYYFELINYLQHFKMIAELRKTTMGHITQDHLKQSRIAIPPKNLCEELEKQIDPILKSVISNRQQNIELSELRDWLLPMLMNGQVTLRQARFDSAQRIAGQRCWRG